MNRLSRLFRHETSALEGRYRRRVVRQEELSNEGRRQEIGALWISCVDAVSDVDRNSTFRKSRACDRRCGALAAASGAVRRLRHSSMVEVIAQQESEQDFVAAVGRVVCTVACEGVEDQYCVAPLGEVQTEDTNEDVRPERRANCCLSADALENAAACAAVLLLFVPESLALILLRTMVVEGALCDARRAPALSRAVAATVETAYPRLIETVGAEATACAVEVVAPGLAVAALADAVPLPAVVACWDEFFHAVRKSRHCPTSADDIVPSSPTCEESGLRRSGSVGEGNSCVASMSCSDEPAMSVIRCVAALIGSCHDTARAAAEARPELCPAAVVVAVVSALGECADATRLVEELEMLDDVMDVNTTRDLLDAVAGQQEDKSLYGLPCRLAACPSRRSKLERLLGHKSSVTLTELTKAAADDSCLAIAFKIAASVETSTLSEDLKEDSAEASVPIEAVRAAVALLSTDLPPTARLVACLEACAPGDVLHTNLAIDLVAAAALPNRCLDRLRAKARALRLLDPKGVPIDALARALLSDPTVATFLYACQSDSSIDLPSLIFVDSTSVAAVHTEENSGRAAQSSSTLCAPSHATDDRILSGCASSPSKAPPAPPSAPVSACLFCRSSSQNEKASYDRSSRRPPTRLSTNISPDDSSCTFM